MKPPKTIYVHKYAAHVFAEKEDRSNTVEYSLKGEELRSLKKVFKRWGKARRRKEIDYVSGYADAMLFVVREIERRLK